MATEYTYKLIVSTSEPTVEYVAGTLWLNTATGEVRIRTGNWTLWITANPISFTAGTYNRTLISQATEPTSADIGQLWWNTNTKQMYFYTDGWYVGGV